MNIVVLDGYLAGFDGLRPFLPGHKLTWRNSTPENRIAACIGDAQGVVVNRAPITRQVLEACPNLTYIGTLGTGFNMVDLAAAREHGVTVCNVPGYSTNAVAQGTMALLLEIAGGTGYYTNYVRSGSWTNPLDKGLTDYPMRELSGMTLGIVGPGAIGSAVAALAGAFGMKVLACRSRQGIKEASGLTIVSFEELLEHSDVISLHCPLNDSTRGMINQAAIDRMKDGVILLNTARGALLDEAAVTLALNNGKIARLGADVLAVEPPDPAHPLARHPNAVITPHIAWMPRQTRQRLLEAVAANILAFAAGSPQNMVR